MNVRNVGSGGGEERAWTAECWGVNKQDLDLSTFDLRANKQQVLQLVADILASAQSNDAKERKLGNIIAELETVTRKLAQQTAAAAALKVSVRQYHCY